MVISVPRSDRKHSISVSFPYPITDADINFHFLSEDKYFLDQMITALSAVTAKIMSMGDGKPIRIEVNAIICDPTASMLGNP